MGDDAGWDGRRDPPPRAPEGGDNEAAIQFGRKFGLGCFTFVIGAFSGGMVAVLIGKIVEGMRRAPSCDGLPICNWYVYAGIGALIGAVTLPVLVLRRLGKR